jgi:hypothetical protein
VRTEHDGGQTELTRGGREILLDGKLGDAAGP